MQLETFSSNTPEQKILDALARDGACIVAELATPLEVQRMRYEVEPLIEQTPFGIDNFLGRSTQRTGALVARTPTCRGFVLNPLVTGTARSFLKPFNRKRKHFAPCKTIAMQHMRSLAGMDADRLRKMELNFFCPGRA